MRYLSVAEVIQIHAAVVADTGGAKRIRDLGALESAVAQPRMAMGGVDLYPSLGEKANAICYSLVLNHPFEDGNKRVGHAAMEVFLELNGMTFSADVDKAERMILDLAAGLVKRDQLLTWIENHASPVE